jgi:hypothetical protein
MKVFSEGDSGRALCEDCRAVVPTHYARRDVPFSDGRGVAEDILVGVCTHCDTVVAIPPEATLALQRLARLAV